MKLKIILFLFPIICFSQLSAKVDSIYRKIYATDQVQNQIIGMVGSINYPEYDELYTKLDSLATDDEILYIAAKGNKVIKYHMSELLVDRKSKHLRDLFAQYIFKNEEIYISTGCMGYNSSLAGTLYNYIFYQNAKIESVKYNNEHFTSEELEEDNYLPTETKWTKPEVDSLLISLNRIALTNDNILPVTLSEIFETNKFKFENEIRIRYFANKYPTSEILATLASFQNKKDLPLLHKNIDKSFLAISKFPDKSFIPELKKMIDKCTSDYHFMDAATAFCSIDSEELLNMIVAKFDEKKEGKKELWMSDAELFDYFYQCLEKKNCSFNNDFLIKLWTNNRKISYSFFLKIKDKHYDDLLKGYINPLPFDSATFDKNMEWEPYKKEWEENNGYLCPIILKYLKDNSSLNKNKPISLDTIECKG